MTPKGWVILTVPERTAQRFEGVKVRLGSETKYAKVTVGAALEYLLDFEEEHNRKGNK